VSSPYAGGAPCGCLAPSKVKREAPNLWFAAKDPLSDIDFRSDIDFLEACGLELLTSSGFFVRRGRANNGLFLCGRSILSIVGAVVIMAGAIPNTFDSQLHCRR